MRILAINPNTSTTMTAAIGAAAQAAASAGTTVEAMQPTHGPEAIDCAFEGYVAAAAVLELAPVAATYDAVLLAGFGEPGRDGLAELLTVPVFDIAESAAHVAMMIGRSYSVVTTLQRSVAAIEDRLRLAGLDDRCASVRACGLSTAELDADPVGSMAAIVSEAARAIELDRAEVICLGCGGMAELAEAITDQLGVPVVDGVAAAVRLAEAIVGLGLSTSKICTFAVPELNVVAARPTGVS